MDSLLFCKLSCSEPQRTLLSVELQILIFFQYACLYVPFLHVMPFPRMRSTGSCFTLGVWGLRVCSLDVAVKFATFQPALYTPHSTLPTCHFTLYTPHSTLYTLHSTLLHSTLHTLHFTLCTVHSSLHTSHSTLYARRFGAYGLRRTTYEALWVLVQTLSRLFGVSLRV